MLGACHRALREPPESFWIALPCPSSNKQLRAAYLCLTRPRILPTRTLHDMPRRLVKRWIIKLAVSGGPWRWNMDRGGPTASFLLAAYNNPFLLHCCCRPRQGRRGAYGMNQSRVLAHRRDTHAHRTRLKSQESRGHHQAQGRGDRRSLSEHGGPGQPLLT